ncbi:transporter substrate-binding domain-containing protein [Shewanella olleyana]|uniref:ATP-binding protein n=1 Tax=Shewanella olleyana TaxID=135626 RepID=UPI00200EAA04|nr:transporter substrate-binding domain-containing protein [Shewanella olleyana]MCL1067851.1 transporter substrate-binding domain-containing protein [Shewanella olleyana]
MKYWLGLLLLFSFPSIAKETIVFGVHSTTAPLEWRDNGVDQGFHVELMNSIGQLLDKPIMVRRKTFQQLMTDMHDANSQIDVVAVVSPTNVRRELSQSDPIYATHAKAYTLQGKDYIDNWSDLVGKRVAIKSGAFVDVFLTNQPQNFTQVKVDLYETGFQKLMTDEVDVVLAENFVARRLQPKYPLVRSSSDALIFGAFTFVSNPENAALLKEINDALRQLKISGEYDRLVNKWFGMGREKFDITSTQRKMLTLSIVISIISAMGMLYTFSVSRSLKYRSEALALELEQREIAEQKIRSLSQQFQAVLDGIPHGMTIFDHQMKCLWSNDNNQLLTHSQFHYVDGTPFDLSASVKSVIESKKSLIADMGYLAQYWQVQIHPIADEQAVVLLEENTEQQHLRQANDEASRLASLGELSAGVAHEINNPTGIIIHSIALFAEAMKDLRPAADYYQQQNPFWLVAGLEPQAAFDEISHSTEVVEESAKRISRIVNDLKRYALPNIAANHQSISLNEVVQVAQRLTSNQLKRYQVNIELQQPSPLINGDAQQLHQVMINLIQNACHATPAGTGLISIKTFSTETAAYICVEDNGSGMNKETLKRITEPFFTTRRSHGGSGLGLSVCSRILKEHHGHMKVTSTLNEGSCFTLVFSALPPLNTDTFNTEALNTEALNTEALNTKAFNTSPARS